MSKRRDFQARVRLFGELRDVFDAMKTMAVVEIGKLGRTQRYRGNLLEEIDRVARATAAYHPVAAARGRPLYLIVGSERGFCGDFNERILEFWERQRSSIPEGDVIVVGKALAERFPAEPPPLAAVPGPWGADDIDATLGSLLERLAERQLGDPAPLALFTVATGANGVAFEPIVPLPQPPVLAAIPPRLHLAPERFFAQFIEQFIDARLHDVFAGSLLAENHARVQHMTVATNRLDDDVQDLRRHIHRLRQEEITQEVEMILLSAGLGG